MNIHHIGYLVKKGPKAQAAFEALGYIAEGEWTHDEIRKFFNVSLPNDSYSLSLLGALPICSFHPEHPDRERLPPHLCGQGP